MPWTAPRTWANNELVDASIMNAQVRDNLSYLLTPNSFNVRENTGTYTATSTTYVNIGSSNTLVTNGGLILLGVHLYVGGNNGTNYDVVFTVDSTDYPIYSGPAAGILIASTIIIPGLAAGSHSCSLRYRAPGGATLTVTKTNNPLIFWGIEL